MLEFDRTLIIKYSTFKTAPDRCGGTSGDVNLLKDELELAGGDVDVLGDELELAGGDVDLLERSDAHCSSPRAKLAQADRRNASALSRSPDGWRLV